MGGESMPAGNFNGELHVHADGIVEAAGPFDIAVTKVSEMCVWVVQRDGADDAIANAMGSPDDGDGAAMPDMADMPGMPHHSGLKVFDLGTPNARWVFPLTHLFKPVGFCSGSASAMATGVFVDKDKKQRSFFWSEPVRLIVHDSETAG
jgi:hypothetical protein